MSACLALFPRSRDSVAGITNRMNAGHPMNSDLIPGRSERFFSSPKLPESAYGHPVFYEMSTGGSFSWVKAVGAYSLPLTSIWWRD